MGVVLFLVIIVVVIAIILVFVTKLGQRFKGNIVLSLGNSHFAPGQDISGIITVTAKKELGPGSLVTSLVCIEEWYETTTDRDGHQSRDKKTKEIYRHDLELDRSLTMQAGGQQAVPFVLPTPQPQDTVASDRDAPGWQRALRAVGDMLSPDRETYWEVEARYDIPGLDLTSEQRIPLYYDFG